MRVIQFLKDNKFKTAYPIISNQNNYIQKFNDGYAIIYEFINGSEPTLNEEVAFEIGQNVSILSLLKIPNDTIRDLNYLYSM